LTSEFLRGMARDAPFLAERIAARLERAPS
jgi:hypothetical protein